MTLPITAYLKEDKGALIALKPLKIILHKEDFDNGISTEVDDKIETFGVFRIISMDGKDKYQCKYPIVIPLNVIEREIVDGEVILIYNTNDVIINSMTFFKGAKQANRFLDLMVGGKFLGLNQEDVVYIFEANMDQNGTGIGVKSEIVEVMVSELFRWKEDNSIPYRIKSNTLSEDHAQFLSIKEVARTSSVFNSLAFEDVKKALQSATTMTRKGTKQRISPIEKAI